MLISDVIPRRVASTAAPNSLDSKTKRVEEELATCNRHGHADSSRRGRWLREGRPLAEIESIDRSVCSVLSICTAGDAELEAKGVVGTQEVRHGNMFVLE